VDGGPPIRTPDQRLRVFVSSTLAELAEERAAVREAIERLQLTPVLFELGARPHPPRALYRTYLEQSHVFIGLYWQRYGWVAPGEPVSGLEDEYALSAGMPRLLYVKQPAPDRETRLGELLERIQTEDTASYKLFRTPAELAEFVSADLALLLTERFLGPSAQPDAGTSRAPRQRRRHNLPAELSSFVGRERELADVRRAVVESRLVTLTGLGGSGKSRLAVRVAAELVDRWPDGAWLVELASLTRPDRVPTAVAAALGIAEDPHRPLVETLADELRERQLLVVLDNCEHLLEPCAEFAAALLREAPGLRVLATSREALAVPGEVVIAVQPLDLPPVGDDTGDVTRIAAVRLFAERAAAVRPDFAVTPANAAAVAALVRSLDGLPLALELAAARVNVLSVEQIAGRLSDRFGLLSGGARTVMPRQQTLRAAMDWSYELLDPVERRVLRRLSVFLGRWTLDAAEAVCPGAGVETAQVLDAVARLVAKSLVVVVEGAPENRYRLLETVRDYGRQRLRDAGEVDQTRTAHRDWYGSLVESGAAHARGGREQARWLARLELEHDDIQAALEWSWSAGDATAGLRMVIAVAWFWYLHGHWDEADRALERSLAVDGAEPVLRAKATAWAAVFAWRRGDLTRAENRAARSLDALAGGGDEAEGLALLALTLVAISRSDQAAAEQHGRHALEVFRAQQHAWGVTTTLLVLSRIAVNRRSGRIDALLQESAAMVASGSDLWSRTHLLILQGYEAFRALDLDLADQLHSAAHTLAVELGDRAAQAENLLALGHVHLLRGADEDAARALSEARLLVENLGDQHDLGHVDQGLALLALSRGDAATGQALLDDVASRFHQLDKAEMAGSHALGMAEVYRRAGHPALAAALLRHALSFLDQTRDPDRYSQARQELTAMESAASTRS
jgi:predicted ATPase